jgi:hypothetical protein
MPLMESRGKKGDKQADAGSNVNARRVANHRGEDDAGQRRAVRRFCYDTEYGRRDGTRQQRAGQPSSSLIHG